jgi:hypothetical protein
MKTYFISFVEEFWTDIDPKYKDYVFGRVEIYDGSDGSHFAIDEIRFLTNKKSWYKFRDKWDFKDVTEKELESIRKIIESKYLEKGKL